MSDSSWNFNVDWSRPVEVIWNKAWFPVTGVMRKMDGSIWTNPNGDLRVSCEGKEFSFFVEPWRVRNTESDQ
jgi:hypothetical protein